jgi:hypothetical protein
MVYPPPHDSWHLIGLNILFASNQISRIFTHENPVDSAKGSPNVSKGELLAGEDAPPAPGLWHTA